MVSIIFPRPKAQVFIPIISIEQYNSTVQKKVLIQKKIPAKFLFGGIFFFVELGGVEPPSKQGNNKLSTCLSSLKFSCADKTEATYRRLIPLGFIQIAGPIRTIFDLAAPPYHWPRSHGLWEMSRSNTLCRN